jgi:hypothetical protein
MEDYNVDWFLDDCDEMLNDPGYDWAMKTIEGIQRTIEKTGIVTKDQARAIRNIRAKGKK